MGYGEKDWFNILNNMSILSITRSEPNEELGVLHVYKSGKGKKVALSPEDQQIVDSFTTATQKKKN